MAGLDVIWADRQDLPASDRGLAYGDGLFETIRVEGDQPLLLRRHLERLVAGARRLAIPLPPDQLQQLVGEALEHYGRPSAWVLKLVLTRGSGGRGYRPPTQCRPRLVLSCHAMPPLPAPDGVTATVASTPLVVNPELSGLKSLNRLEQVMASQNLPAESYEAVFTDTGGRLLEGTRTNLLVRFDGQWWQPPAEGIAVAGVMAAALADGLTAAGERVRQRPLPLSLLTRPECEGLYLTNSVIGAVPVRKLGCLYLPIDNTLATICDPLKLPK